MLSSPPAPPRDNATANSSSHHSDDDSGWTFYLQHSSSSSSSSSFTSPSYPNKTHHHQRKNKNKTKKKKNKVPTQDIHAQTNYNTNPDYVEEEEEDLSMVSDASSGPPHFHLNDAVPNAYGYCAGDTNLKVVGNKPKDFLNLDDTASSPFYFSPKKQDNGRGTDYNAEANYHYQEGSSSLESLIDYSTSPPAYSTTHFQNRSRHLDQEGYDFLQSPFSADPFQQNQWS